MINYGVKIGFNSDDPAVFNTSLTWQLRIAAGKIGLRTENILQTVHDSLNAAFLNEDEKGSIRKVLEDFDKRNTSKQLLNLQSNTIERIFEYK